MIQKIFAQIGRKSKDGIFQKRYIHAEDVISKEDISLQSHTEDDTRHIPKGGIKENQIADGSITLSKLSSNINLEANSMNLKMGDGFIDLGLDRETSTLFEVMYRISQLPSDHFGVFRFGIDTAEMAQRMDLPTHVVDSALLIERPQRSWGGSRNMILTYYSGASNNSNVQIFVTNHSSTIPTQDSVDNLTWRELTFGAVSQTTESGTWTPRVNAGATIVNNNCRFVRNGNTVTLFLHFAITKGTATGIIDITGLPFNPRFTHTRFGTLLGNRGNAANAIADHGLGLAQLWIRSGNSIRVHLAGESTELTFENTTLTDIRIRGSITYEIA